MSDFETSDLIIDNTDRHFSYLKIEEIPEDIVKYLFTSYPIKSAYTFIAIHSNSGY